MARLDWRARLRGQLVVDDVEAEALARMAKLRNEGASLREVATLLAEEGHRTKRGKRWPPPDGHAGTSQRLAGCRGSEGRTETSMRSDRLRRMEGTNSGSVVPDHALSKALGPVAERTSSDGEVCGILERNGPVGAGLYVAAYCLLRLALRLTLLMYTVVLMHGPQTPPGPWAYCLPSGSSASFLP